MPFSISPYRCFHLLLPALLFVLSGCGGAYWQWSKPGVSQQQAKQDSFECKQISRQPYLVGTGGLLVGGSGPEFNTWKECLEARGYTVTQASDSQDSSHSVPQGNRCVASNATIGLRVKAPDGKMGRVRALYGTSPQCSNPAYPLVADVEDVGSAQGSHCVSASTTLGTRVTLPNGKRGRVMTLYGASPRCSDPATPILVDVEEE